MGVRATSRAAFDEVKPDLGRRQAAVLAELRSNGPSCNQEIAEGLGWPINTVTPRVNELVERGKVREAFRERYAPTNRRVIFWAANG
ncbi:winged helix-turn-helix domain-containing protein [Mycobacteroides abscessus]|uniref:winged helix-turn-helix domain-containing protein n=1 Tax=Mycobacteroides abscessus TaxID=36809 RepID=UPI0018963F68